MDVRIYRWADEKELFKVEFLKILEDSAEFDFFVVDFGYYYVQYKAFAHEQGLYVEAVSNNYLQEGLKLSTTQVDQIIKLGFEIPKAEDPPNSAVLNYSKFYHRNTTMARLKVLDKLLILMQNIYGISRRAEIKIRFEKVK
jgi:hypothetical protein